VQLPCKLVLLSGVNEDKSQQIGLSEVRTTGGRSGGTAAPVTSLHWRGQIPDATFYAVLDYGIPPIGR
jgi:hypothetical protein